MAGQGAYREISSCSNCQDFQSRRMGLRYREPPAEGKLIVHVIRNHYSRVTLCLHRFHDVSNVPL